VSDQDEDNDFAKNRIKWEFFKLHANQRLTFFRFYIGLVVALFVAYFYILDHMNNCHGTHFLHFCLLCAGAGICSISWMFNSLDLRNVELIENVKNVLPEIKGLSKNDPKNARGHRMIFKVAFMVIFFVGVFLIGLSFFKYGYDISRCASTFSETCPITSHDNKCLEPLECKNGSSVTTEKTIKDADTKSHSQTETLGIPLMEATIPSGKKH
jgi:hypothetical protein